MRCTSPNSSTPPPYQQLRGGDPWALIVADHSGIYSFTVWPVNTRTAPHPPLPTLRGRHRKRLAELVHAPP
ncbi:hypothetical protein ACIQNG_28365 [Streptomyces sp. NPDC091377]|uniref:hypothetical protein n=1 Tax=Streptomyces sp. NPDC091377 TaxID=3365995 RepID=UPI003825FF02